MNCIFPNFPHLFKFVRDYHTLAYVYGAEFIKPGKSKILRLQAFAEIFKVFVARIGR
jgi:hypothetical protein